MVFSSEQEIALAVILAAIEDFYMQPVTRENDNRDSEEVEFYRESARLFFYGGAEDSHYALYAEMLGVEPLPPDEVASNIIASGRKMGGKIKKSAMVNIIGDW